MTARPRAAHERAYLAAAVVAIVAGVGVRLYFLDFSLWYDEIAAVFFARQPASLLWSSWMLRETNPPLFYTLLHYWIDLFGVGDRAVKSLSVLIGAVGMILAALLAKRLAGTWAAGAVAATLLALSSPNIIMSQQARGYILSFTAAAWVGLAMVAIFATYARREDRLRPGILWRWVALWAGMSVALYSHTTMVIFYVVANGVALRYGLRGWRIDGRFLLHWTACNVAILATYGWWIWITVHQTGSGNANISWMTKPTAADIVLILRQLYLPGMYGILSKLCLVAMIGSLVAAVAWRRRFHLLVLLGLCCAGFALSYAISLTIPILTWRSIFWTQVFFVAALSGAIVAIRPAWARVAITTLLSAASIVQTAHALPERETDKWDKAVRYMATAAPGSIVLVRGEGLALNIRHYCTIEYPAGCPIRVQSLDVEHRVGWANGLSGYPVLSSTRDVRGSAPFFVADWFTASPSPALRADGGFEQIAARRKFGWVTVERWRRR